MTTSKDVWAFQRSTFGPTTSYVAKLGEEVQELCEALAAAGQCGADGEAAPADLDDATRARLADELADVAIVLCGVAGRVGIDLDGARARKLDVLRSRVWRVDEHGVRRHVPGWRRAGRGLPAGTRVALVADVQSAKSAPVGLATDVRALGAVVVSWRTTGNARFAADERNGVRDVREWEDIDSLAVPVDDEEVRP